MSNERIDEFLSWRHRLDDPRGVPGQGLDDREATWERLMDKIAETPRRRRFFGYRLAAACMLLALIPAIRLFQGRHVRVVTMRPVELRRVVAPWAPPGRKIVPAAVATRTPETRRTAVAARTPGTPRTPAAGLAPIAAAPQPHRQVRTGPPAAPVNLAVLTPPTTVSATPPDSAVTTQTTAKPLKTKPLRVIHINELPGGGGPAPAVTATGASKHFEIFLSPPQINLSSSN
jgi:hypothetical protein